MAKHTPLRVPVAGRPDSPSSKVNGRGGLAYRRDLEVLRFDVDERFAATDDELDEIQARALLEGRVLRIFVIALVMALAALLASRCEAQSPASTVCARAAIGEISWNNLEAAVAVTAVHARRAEAMGVPLGRACYLYSAALRTCARPWVCYLDGGKSPPAYWPAHLDWPKHRERFRLIREVLEWHFAGMWPDPCRADHYGGPMDAAPARWKSIACVRRTRQRFYRRSER